MIAYFDTSAIVKLLVDESDSEVANALWDATGLAVTSRLSYVEARAALAQAHRLDRLDAAGHRAAVSDLDDLWDELSVVEARETWCGEQPCSRRTGRCAPTTPYTSRAQSARPRSFRPSWSSPGTTLS